MQALLLAACVLQAASAPVEQRPESRPRLIEDAAVAAYASLTVAAIKPDIRRALLREASFARVVENFTHPVRQLERGTRRDSDPFWVNNLAHPGLFALEALCLKRRGYGDGSAFLFTQVHSVVWEFVVEGSAFEPSGKDLVADAAGAAAALWVLRPVASRAQRRIDAGRGRLVDRVARWLDPVSALLPVRTAPRVSVSAHVLPEGAFLRIALTF